MTVFSVKAEKKKRRRDEEYKIADVMSKEVSLALVCSFNVYLFIFIFSRVSLSGNYVAGKESKSGRSGEDNVFPRLGWKAKEASAHDESSVIHVHVICLIAGSSTCPEETRS